ncbi:MAG: sulfite exporter TauE/SafE family protein [bacterium]|nr:sulfite exporter TauE/SafE family protein [bacterium]
MDILFYIIPLFFIIAIIYSSVGFGGGSSYLAVLAVLSFSYTLMPKISLFCNITVVTGGCYIYYKSGHLKFTRVLPFLIGSVPLSFIGGNILIQKEIFLFILAVTLIIAASNMTFFDTRKRAILKQDYFTKKNKSFNNSPVLEVLIGCVLGFISGLVGIGGGIFLAPLLYLMRWGYAKQISATASFFILINSIAGLSGQFAKSQLVLQHEMVYIIPAVLTVFLGGQIGSRLGAFKLSEIVIKRTTAIVVFFVGFRMLMKLGF